MTAPDLRRYLEPRAKPRPGERCEMCTEPIPDEHPHVVDVHNRSLLCTCKACSLLFDNPAAAKGRYRAVGSRYRYAPTFAITDAQWDALQIPVRTAFFFVNSAQSSVAAFYPSPAGATESLLTLEAWDELMAANPVFSDLLPDVEAILLHESEGFLVPIDLCYELVGRVRRTWKGFDGGQEARAEIEAFFARLRERGS